MLFVFQRVISATSRWQYSWTHRLGPTPTGRMYCTFSATSPVTSGSARRALAVPSSVTATTLKSHSVSRSTVTYCPCSRQYGLSQWSVESVRTFLVPCGCYEARSRLLIVNPLMPTVTMLVQLRSIMCWTGLSRHLLFWHPGTLTLRTKRQSARMSKITNDGLTCSGTGCVIAVPVWQQRASRGWSEVSSGVFIVSVTSCLLTNLL